MHGVLPRRGRAGNRRAAANPCLIGGSLVTPMAGRLLMRKLFRVLCSLCTAYAAVVQPNAGGSLSMIRSADLPIGSLIGPLRFEPIRRSAFLSRFMVQCAISKSWKLSMIRSVVARASRPCEPEHTGETPVPLPLTNLTRSLSETGETRHRNQSWKYPRLAAMLHYQNDIFDLNPTTI